MNVTCTSETCDYVLNSKCVFYEGMALPYAGINTNDSLETALQKINEAIQDITISASVEWGDITGLLGNQADLIAYFNNFTPITRNLTINGVTYDLSADRSWTVGGGDYTPQGVTLATVGGIPSGTDLGVSPILVQDLFDDIFYPYVSPVFTSFSISGQSTTIEVGTTLSGSKTFTWAITLNSGVVPTIDLYNVTTSATLLAGTPNDGSQAQAITSVQLNSNGATQVWRGIGNNTSPAGTFNSSNFTVTSRYYRWWEAVAATPANSAAVRALSNQAFQTAGNSFTLVTGTTLIKFSVNLPPGVTIVSVIDTTNLNLDITADYVLIGTVSVLDAGGTSRTYNQYEMNIAVPYGTSANHVILTT